MFRPLRLEYAGALYHVASRGDRQENIYEGDADRRLFLVTYALTTIELVMHIV